jgi:colanic acid/amylovoran biosynthesis glycosyltransferase
MSEVLAVFTPQLGTISETFVRRHVENVLPGRTVVVAGQSSHPMGGRWAPSCPVLFLDRWSLRPSVRILRRLGWRNDRLCAIAIATFLRRHRVSVVMGEYLDQFIDFVAILDALQMPYIVQGHGIDLSAALRRPGVAARYAVYRSARRILTRCEFHRRRLIGVGLPADRIAVNPGGVDVPERPMARPPNAAKRFLALGRMVPKKGPIYLLQAFRLCADRDDDVSLDYVGDGELLPAARQFVDAVGLTGRVRLHGAASNDVKEALLRECGIFVQHSVIDPDTGDEEGLPASIQEAMAHGMAVVSTRHSGIPEMVEHGTMGLLVGERNISDMAGAMARLSQTEEWRRFGINAWQKARRLYSWPAERARLLHYLAGPDTVAEAITAATSPA